jgi:hypothetical protein
MNLNIMQRVVSDLLEEKRIVVCVAPRRSGKTKLCNYLLEKYQNLGLAVSKRSFATESDECKSRLHPYPDVIIYDEPDYINNFEKLFNPKASVKKILLIGTPSNGIISKYAKEYPSVHFNGYVFHEDLDKYIKPYMGKEIFEAEYVIK